MDASRAALALLAAALLLGGCLGSTPPPLGSQDPKDTATDALYWVTDHLGGLVKDIPPALQQELSVPIATGISYTGKRGGEPNVGVSRSGSVFTTSGTFTMKSTDHGVTWSVAYDHRKEGAPGLNGSSDPMLWVDPVTDRIFTDHMFGLHCSNMAFSDDDGKTWTQRPLACGIPGNDHQKWASAPWSKKPGLPAPPNYPSAVYYCYNKAVAVTAIGQTWCAVSYNGGLVFQHDQPVASRSLGHPCGGINGHPAWAPDGTLYVPLNRGCGRPVVALTEDNGLTWTVRSGPDKHGAVEIDPEITVTPDGTAYFLWRGSDHQQYLARSKDKFVTWDGPWKVNPPHVKGTVFAGLTSGDNGRIAMAYLGTPDNLTAVGGGTWSPSVAANTTRWNLYVTYSLNAADPQPLFATSQANPSDDPIQIGCVWLNGGGNPCRNLLDFIDMASDKDGRIFVAITDGCTTGHAAGDCARNPKATAEMSRNRTGGVALALSAPSLKASHERIVTLLPQQPIASRPS